jgi:hypothetical protein
MGNTNRHVESNGSGSDDDDDDDECNLYTDWDAAARHVLRNRESLILVHASNETFDAQLTMMIRNIAIVMVLPRMEQFDCTGTATH